ncbi:hypothetical protein Tco_1005753 [Tanacetum coccineum]|uniref:Uncharacterized protein n=1 Tax=Tanacetum coccineum TaxID=301880 RepID=A0ABQ5FGY1_9ASTR
MRGGVDGGWGRGVGSSVGRVGVWAVVVREMSVGRGGWGESFLSLCGSCGCGEMGGVRGLVEGATGGMVLGMCRGRKRKNTRRFEA